MQTCNSKAEHRKNSKHNKIHRSQNTKQLKILKKKIVFNDQVESRKAIDYYCQKINRRVVSSRKIYNLKQT